MNSLVAILLLTAVTTAPADATRFAISCKGKAVFEHKFAGSVPTSETMPTGEQVYVIDEKAQTVARALFPRKMFDDTCALFGPQCVVRFSPQSIITSGTKNDGEMISTNAFEFDRPTGTVEYRLDLIGPGDTWLKTRWTMSCVPTAIPVFTGVGE